MSFLSDLALTFESDMGLEAILNIALSTAWHSASHLIGIMG